MTTSEFEFRKTGTQVRVSKPLRDPQKQRHRHVASHGEHSSPSQGSFVLRLGIKGSRGPIDSIWLCGCSPVTRSCIGAGWGLLWEAIWSCVWPLKTGAALSVLPDSQGSKKTQAKGPREPLLLLTARGMPHFRLAGGEPPPLGALATADFNEGGQKLLIYP